MDANQRRGVALGITWAATAGGVGLFVWETEAYNPNMGHFAPPWVSFAFIGCVAVAIIGANIAGRLKLTDVVVRAFETGFKSAERHFIEMRNGGTYRKTENDHDDEEEGHPERRAAAPRAAAAPMATPYVAPWLGRKFPNGKG